MVNSNNIGIYLKNASLKYYVQSSEQTKPFISVCGRNNEQKATTIVTETYGSVINCLVADIHQDLKIFS